MTNIEKLLQNTQNKDTSLTIEKGLQVEEIERLERKYVEKLAKQVDNIREQITESSANVMLKMTQLLQKTITTEKETNTTDDKSGTKTELRMYVEVWRS